MEKVLILGGTNFIGRNLINGLMKSGQYEITLFNRGQTNPGLFPELKKIRGDRNSGEVYQIANESWDYVIDISCYYPDSLENILQQLDDKLRKYIFISTCSAYYNEPDAGILKDENAATLECSSLQRIAHNGDTYGNRKAECERVLLRSEVNHVILRPALVYGAYDNTDRFYYWLYQVRHHDPLLLPDGGERQFSLTYVEDLVETILRALGNPSVSGAYNAITVPQGSIALIVNMAKQLLGKEPAALNASPAFLHQRNVTQWTGMPLWIDGDHYTYKNDKLLSDLGVQLTPFEQSVRRTLDYYENLGWPEPVFGMEEKMRAELISKVRSPLSSVRQ